MGPSGKSSDPLSRLHDAGQIATYEWFLDDDVLMFAPALMQLLGSSQTRIRAADFLQLVLDEDRQGLSRMLAAAAAGKADTYGRSFRIVHPSRGIRLLVDRGIIERTASGQAAKLCGFMLDVTDVAAHPPASSESLATAQNAQQALVASEARLRAALRAGRLGVHEYDPRTDTVFWDSTVRKIWGVPAEESVTYETFRAGLHPDDLAATEAAVSAALDPDGQRRYEATYRVIHRETSEVRWVVADGDVSFEDRTPVRLVGTARDITEEKKKEAALAMSEARYRGLVDLMPAAMYTCDAEGHITFFNEQAEDIWGSAPQLGQRQTDFFERFRLWRADGTPLAPAQTPMAKAWSAGVQSRSEELNIERPDGERVTVVVSVDPFIGPDNAIGGAVAVFLDISAHKRALERLRRSEARLQAFAHASSDSTYRMSKDWREMLALQGRGFLSELGARGGEWLERYVPEADRERVKAGVAAAIAARGVFELEHRVIRADATIGWTLSRAVPILDEEGAIVEWFGAFSDVTTRKEAEIALRESEARFRALADMTSDWYWEQDENFRFVEFSESVQALAGSSAGSHIGKARWELPHTGISDEEWQAHRALLERHEPFRQLEYRRVNERGETIWMSASGDPIFDADGRFKGYRGTGSNITARKEAALRAAYGTFRHLVERSPFGIYVVDAEFRLVQISQGASKVFENVGPLLGRDFAEVIRAIWSEPFASEVIGLFRRTLETGEPYHSLNTVERRADVEATEAYDWQIERISLPDGRLGVVCHFYDLSERLRHEEQIKLLMREINHRSKNLLSLIQAIARQTASTGTADFLERFSQRVHCLAAAQDLLVSNDWRSVPMADLVRSQLSHFADLIDTRIIIKGPRVSLLPAGTQALGLVLHELATNAAKYGALSREEGRIMIEWNVERHEGERDAQFWVSWLERGGPPAVPPSRLGFGHTVITNMARLSVDGEVVVDYGPEGLSWRLQCLATNLVSGRDAVRLSALATARA